MEIVNLDTREKQNAFMNPARQDILRLLQLAGRPMTPKELADKMGISASSVTFHIKKLAELGVVALDHTEQIRGITARYYKALNVSVRLGLLAPGGDDAAQEMFLQRTVEQVLAGVRRRGRDGAGRYAQRRRLSHPGRGRGAAAPDDGFFERAGNAPSRHAGLRVCADGIQRRGGPGGCWIKSMEYCSF